METTLNKEFQSVFNRTSRVAFACEFATGEFGIVFTYPYIAVQGKDENEAKEILQEVLIDWFEERDSASKQDQIAYDNLRMPFFEKMKLVLLVLRSRIGATFHQTNGGPKQGHTICRIEHAL